MIVGVVRLACETLAEAELIGEATGGADAIARAAELRPDLIVLDLDLPDMDGLETLSALREAGFDGITLALSERADGAVVLDAMRRGASGFLTKPDGLRKIGEAIRALLAGERVVNPSLEQAAVLELGRFARQAREGSEVVGTVTPREREVLSLLAEGLTMQQIGRRLSISPRTVETHVAKLYRKLSARSRVQAVARAVSLGLIELD